MPCGHNYQTLELIINAEIPDLEWPLSLDKQPLDINRVFARNGIAFEIDETGHVKRTLSKPLQRILTNEGFHTGEIETDQLLTSAVQKFTSPHIENRQDALEKLWDAFERIKTLEPGTDKKAKADAILDKVSTETKFRETLGKESQELTRIGNSFRIRHSETSQEALSSSEEVDYLFHRMYSFLLLVLKSSDRWG